MLNPTRCRRTPVRLAVVASMAFGVGVACGGGGHAAAPTTAAPSSPTRPASTTTSLAADYSRFTDAADHFSIAVPAAWRKIDPASPDAAQMFHDLATKNPKLKALFGNGPTSLASHGAKFFAIDTSSADYSPSVNVVVERAAGATDSDLPSAADALRAEYQKIGGTVTGSNTVALAGHQALQIKVQLPIAQPTGGAVTVMETQDLVAANDFVYIVTLAGSSPAFPAIQSAFSVS